MALFKLRKKVDETKAPAAPTESIEAVRRRARHRLIGAAVLVLAAVVGFPLLFDTQPRPVAVDIPIEIPDRNKARPLALPSSPAVSVGKVTPAPEAPAAPAAPVVEEAKPEPAPASVAEAKPAPPEKVAKAEPAPERKPEPKAESKPEPKAESKPESKPEPKASVTEAAKAKALLEGKSVDTAANGSRYVVQVGAFAERDKAKLAQQKLDRAGLKNYTNVADTRDGKRIRVRAGPFASRAEADRAAEKIKGLDLPAAVLTL